MGGGGVKFQSFSSGVPYIHLREGSSFSAELVVTLLNVPALKHAQAQNLLFLD